MISPMIQRSQSIAYLGGVVPVVAAAAVITAAAVVGGEIAEMMTADVVWRVGSPSVPSCA